MIPLDTALAFCLASIALALAPGPDNFFVLLQSARHGVVCGLWISLGLCCGMLAHTALVAAGVAALVAATPWLFGLLKVLGALYLLWLARQLWRTSPLGHTGAAPRLSSRHYVGRGLLMVLSNPKVSLFFLAFLPQFANAARGSLSVQIVMLGALFLLSAGAVMAMIALAAGRLAPALARHPRWLVGVQRLAAFIFALLAARLLYETALGLG